MKRLFSYLTFALALSLSLAPALAPAFTADESCHLKLIAPEYAQYLLPDDHPAKVWLDTIFRGKIRLLSSVKNLNQAGFISPKERNRGIVIGRHRELQGYLLKMYLDSKDVDELKWWLKRIKGAMRIQASIDKNNYNHLMKTPKKWIYQLPNDGPQPKKSKYPKKYILVVEDMDIFSDEECRQLYQKVVTPEHLDAMYKMLTTCLLSDCTWLPNIPFSHDGRIAFIDTEFVGETQSIWTRLPRLAKHLSPDMKKYWMSLLSLPAEESDSKNNPWNIFFKSANKIEDEGDIVDSEAFDVPSYADDILKAN